MREATNFINAVLLKNKLLHYATHHTAAADTVLMLAKMIDQHKPKEDDLINAAAAREEIIELATGKGKKSGADRDVLSYAMGVIGALEKREQIEKQANDQLMNVLALDSAELEAQIDSFSESESELFLEFLREKAGVAPAGAACHIAAVQENLPESPVNTAVPEFEQNEFEPRFNAVTESDRNDILASLRNGHSVQLPGKPNAGYNAQSVSNDGSGEFSKIAEANMVKRLKKIENSTMHASQNLQQKNKADQTKEIADELNKELIGLNEDLKTATRKLVALSSKEKLKLAKGQTMRK